MDTFIEILTLHVEWNPTEKDLYRYIKFHLQVNNKIQI